MKKILEFAIIIVSCSLIVFAGNEAAKILSEKQSRMEEGVRKEHLDKIIKSYEGIRF
jgi:hypothetical protein